MDLLTFFKENRLKGFRYDECGDAEVVGKFGHLFEYSFSMFGVCMEGAGTKRLERRKCQGVAAGMTLALDCDFGEAILHFDATDKQQARAAICIAGIRLKRRISESQRERLKKIGFRPSPGIEQTTL